MNSSWEESKQFVSNDDPVSYGRQASDVGTIGQTRMSSSANPNYRGVVANSSYTASIRRPQASASLDPNGFMGHDAPRDQVIFNSAPQVRPNLDEYTMPPHTFSSSQTYAPNTRPYVPNPTQPPRGTNVSRGSLSGSFGSSSAAGLPPGYHPRAPYAPTNEMDQLSSNFKSMGFGRTDYQTGTSSYFDNQLREEMHNDMYLQDHYSLPEPSHMSFYSRNSPSMSPSPSLQSPLASPSVSAQFPFQITEIPSRNVVVRKIDPEIDDGSVINVFRRFGELKSFESQRSRGYLSLSYYDLRAAIQAVTMVKKHPSPFDACYTQPIVKGNGPPQNQGTLVVFNIDMNLKDDDIKMHFLPYGEIKEIRLSPKKADQKFIEYYDTRCAENALNGLKGTVLGRYKINIEFSRPGGKQQRSISKDEDSDFSRRALSCPDRPGFISPPTKQTMSPRMLASPTPTSPLNYGFQHLLPNPSPRSTSPGIPNQSLFINTLAGEPIESRSSLGSSYSNMPSPHNTIGSPLGNPLGNFGLIGSPVGGSYVGPSQISVGTGSLLGGTSSLGGSGMNSFSGVPRVDSPKKSIDGNDIMNTFGESKDNKLDENNYLILENIASGKDRRTTIMIKNIPNKYGNSAVLQLINRRFKDKYDFWYLPIDFGAKSNFGFAFINFINYIDVIDFFNEFNGFTWPQYSSMKIVEIRYARIQGKMELIRNFQNSSVVGCQHPPMLFKSDGPDRGQPEEWPAIPVGRRKM